MHATTHHSKYGDRLPVQVSPRRPAEQQPENLHCMAFGMWKDHPLVFSARPCSGALQMIMDVQLTASTLQKSSFSFELDVVKTVAPISFAIWMAAEPTPLAPASSPIQQLTQPTVA